MSESFCSNQWSPFVAALVGISCLLMGDNRAGAVIIATGDGTGNTTAPIDDPGWANVGHYGDFTATYLGNRWAIAADHVPLASEIVFDGRVVPVQRGSEVPLRNPSLDDLPDERLRVIDQVDSLTEFTDLRLIRLAEDPGLPPLTIASEAPPFVESTTEVVMMGYGRNRQPSLTTWQATDLGGGNFAWDEEGEGTYTVFGYKYAPGQSKRWGTNTIVADALFQSADQDVLSLVTQFSRSADVATEFESQAAVGDSGGPVFYKSGDQWQLLGIMNLVRQDPIPDQPRETAVFGNLTLMADLSVYRPLIEEIIAPSLQAGDANQDLAFDQLDIVQVLQSGKYLTGQTATWGEGDWNGAPGGRPGNPPAGDGRFDQLDIVAALQSGLYLTGQLAAIGLDDSWAAEQTGIYEGIATGPVDLVSTPIPEPSAYVLALVAALVMAMYSLRHNTEIGHNRSSVFGPVSRGDVAEFAGHV